MNKTLYEYHYPIGFSHVTCYKLVVERETEKMFYGNVFLDDTDIGRRFAVNKDDINQLKQYVLKTKGTVYKVVVESVDHKQTAYNIVSKKLQELINDFKL